MLLLEGPALLNLDERLKLSIHYIDRLVGSLDDCLQKLLCLGDRDLGLLLFGNREGLEGRIKVVLNLCVDLGHEMLLFTPDNLDEI